MVLRRRCIGHVSLLKFVSSTGRLCSAGSGRLPFPDVIARMQPSDSLLSFGRGSGCPLPAAYLVAGCLFLAERRVHPERVLVGD